MVLPQHVLREGVWSDGEGPGLLVGILWFPFWHLFLSVLWALLAHPALAAFPANTLLFGGAGGEGKKCDWQVAKWCWLSTHGGLVC